jgi:hypothetical protein
MGFSIRHSEVAYAKHSVKGPFRTMLVLVQHR